MHIDDRHICDLLKRHDPRGFNLLLDGYYRPLVLWADTFLNDIPAAEDTVQEFIVSFWEKRVYERMHMANFRGFLFTSVRNAALKHIAKHDPLRNTYALGGMILESVEPDDITEEIIREIEAEIEKLPPRTREILRAVYVDGLRYKEVAARFGIAVATVKSMLVKALKRLRDIFSRRI